LLIPKACSIFIAENTVMMIVFLKRRPRISGRVCIDYYPEKRPFMNLRTFLLKLFMPTLAVFFANALAAQVCSLTASATTTTSECKATGTISLSVLNGSGNYNYTVTGPAYNSTTSAAVIGGLQAGFYAVEIKDIVTGCIVNLDSVKVDGTYQDPRFTLDVTDVSCNGAADGVISIANLQFGKPPFSFSIIAPSASAVGTSNANGLFTGLIPGTYTIQLTDSCGGMQTRVVTMTNHTWSVTATAVAKVGCDSADVTLTATDNNGSTNISSPGSFTGFLYGYIRAAGDTLWSNNPNFRFYKGNNRSASFAVKDPCSNIIVTNWTDTRVPNVSAAVSISNQLCNSFTASIKGQQNLTRPEYCLYDAANTLQYCNTTGVFNNLAYGSYCINITDTCYDTTFTRCFTVRRPPPVVQAVNISNRGCDSFTATINATNVANVNYCLYDTNGVQIICNTTGVFNNIAYGSYCVHVQSDPACYDTTVIKCFTVLQPVPAVASNVNIIRGCGVFEAAITGQQNLTNPQYCLYDNSNTQLACNTTGQFPNLAFGSYCIHIINDTACYDTTIVKCFTVSPIAIGISTSANPSCTIGATDVRVTLSNGVAPYTVNIYGPNGVLVYSTTTSGTSIRAYNLPGLATGLKYKVVVAGNCGSLDSVLFTPRVSSLNKNINLNAKCPGGIWQNGSGDIIVSAVFSEGWVRPKLIKRDAAVISVNYNIKTGNNFSFLNLQPGVYIIQYSLENCTNFVYDTFNLKAYDFPSLSQSSVFQCNNNSFNVNAAATGGIPPFTYEIIGSTPSLPSVIQGPQVLPSFTINNGTAYAVIRLRATDGCGNATINDASILPLGNTVVTASSNCYYNNVNLSVDTIPGAVYSWYRKTSATDSTLIGSGPSYNIPYLLPSDTGEYVSVAAVNGGCLTKIASFRVNGSCGGSLLAPDGLQLEGKLQKENTQLRWTTGRAFIAEYFVVQRSNDGIHFEQAGVVTAQGSVNGSSQYVFTDINTPFGKSYYRVASMGKNGLMLYTAIIEISKAENSIISLLENPVAGAFTLQFRQVKAGNYNVRLMDAGSRLLMNANYLVHQNDNTTIQRPDGLPAGVYYLIISNAGNTRVQSLKIVFK
jgi:SprB repeat